MIEYNLIVVFDEGEEFSLFCLRENDPYKGLLNFVGGKVEPGEECYHAAYRELFEETGITADDIVLHRILTTTYHVQDCIVDIFAGCLNKKKVTLRQEKNRLYWFPISQCNYENTNIFAGDGSIYHIMKQINRFGFGV